jgi:hypothetical protein
MAVKCKKNEAKSKIKTVLKTSMNFKEAES